jgi:hypothetical protein
MYRILLKNDDGKADSPLYVSQFKRVEVNHIFYVSLPAEDDPGLYMAVVKGDAFHRDFYPLIPFTLKR